MKTLKTSIETEKQKFSVNQFSLIGAVLFAGLAGYAYFAFLPLFLNSKGFSAGEVTFIMTWMGVGMAIFSWLFGKISDRTGRRKLFFILALFFQVILFSLLNLNNHIIYHCLLNFFRGFLLGMRMPSSNALFADIVEMKNKSNEINLNNGMIEVSGIQLSLLSTTKSTGWAIGVILSSITISIFGIDSLIYFLIITTIISLFFALPVRDIKKEEVIKKENGSGVISEDLIIREPVSGKVEDIEYSKKINYLLFICVFLRHFGLIPFLQIISLLLIDAGIPVEIAGFVIALNPSLQILAMVVNGRIIDNPKITERIMIAVGIGLSALTLLCYSLGTATGSLIYFILGQICLGFGWGSIYTGAVKYIVNQAPQNRALFMGIWITNLQVAKILAYQVFAFLWIIYSPVMVLPYAVLIPIIGMVLVYWL